MFTKLDSNYPANIFQLERNCICFIRSPFSAIYCRMHAVYGFYAAISLCIILVTARSPFWLGSFLFGMLKTDGQSTSNFLNHAPACQVSLKLTFSPLNFLLSRALTCFFSFSSLLSKCNTCKAGRLGPAITMPDRTFHNPRPSQSVVDKRMFCGSET